MIRHRKTQENTYLAWKKWSNPPMSCAFFFCLARNLETWLSEVHPWTWVVDVAGNDCQTNGKTSKQGKPNSIAILCHLESRRQGGLDWEFGNEFWAPNLLIPWQKIFTREAENWQMLLRQIFSCYLRSNLQMKMQLAEAASFCKLRIQMRTMHDELK